MDGTRVSSMSEWLKSDVFIIFVVVLLLAVIAIFAVCWVIRRRRTHKPEKLAEVEIIPFAASGTNSTPRFTLRIITEKKHATELVQMLTGQIRPPVAPPSSTDPGGSAVTAEVASTSQDQPQIYTLSSCHIETDSTLPTGQQVTSPDLQTKNPVKHSVVATVEPIRITDNEENDATGTEQYYPALS